jgi:L-ascorbate metabolism protein UlaG (beta-lactamase superfamily)
MDIQYYGANCIKLTTKEANIIIDDNLAELGLKSVTKDGDIVLRTQYDVKKDNQGMLTIGQPGEYEVSKVAIEGIPARSHMDEEGKQSATIFKLTTPELRVVIAGHIYPELDESQLEALGTVDVLVVPVGGSGYTLDALGALKVIKKIEPKIIIPVHYADKSISYEVPQAELADALKNMSMEVHETVPKLKLKASDLPEAAQVIVLERQ